MCGVAMLVWPADIRRTFNESSPKRQPHTASFAKLSKMAPSYAPAAALPAESHASRMVTMMIIRNR